MTATATTIFEFLQRSETLHLERIDVGLLGFSRLRRAVRRIIEALKESPETAETAGELHVQLLLWLTVPMTFGDYDTGIVKSLGTPEEVRRKWGDDVMGAQVDALSAHEKLRNQPNPLRETIADTIASFQSSKETVRIYCHRTALDHFLAIPSCRELAGRSRLGFLHSPRNYREVEPFDVLLKVGPLRSHGFGSLPGAVLNAPRCSHIVQVAWAGTLDEVGFGSDPALDVLQREPANHLRSTTERAARSDVFVWNRSTLARGETYDSASESSIEVDDFDLRPEAGERHDMRAAVLFHLSGDLGCLQAPHADITCLRCDNVNVYASRMEPRDVDESVTHLVQPDLTSIDFGHATTTNGKYSTIWKQLLHEELDRGAVDIEEKLRSAGIRLRGLSSRLREWIQPPSNVIHAPQQRKHFDLLIEVLGIESDSRNYPRPSRYRWSAVAWAEIGRSRGEAIKHGTEAHDILTDELADLLNSELRHIREPWRTAKAFRWTIPEDRSLEGTIGFYPILEVEDGYRCPDALLKVVLPIERLMSWRE